MKPWIFSDSVDEIERTEQLQEVLEDIGLSDSIQTVNMMKNFLNNYLSCNSSNPSLAIQPKQ